jgi:site-specific DNA recombinase
MTPIVALYARVSTRQQEQETTIESQLAQLLSYAQQQGYRIDPTHQYLDQAVSGTQLNRRGLNQVRDAAAAHEIDLLLCAAPDRLARTLGLQLVLLEEFRRAGVTVVFLDHPQLGTDPQSQLLLQIQGAFAEYERDLIRARLYRGKLYRLRQGQVPARAPYGYHYQARTAESAPTWEVLPATAAVVQQIFTWYAEDGWTLRQIQAQLNAQGTPAPQGEGWQSSGLHYILTQSAYRGIAYVNRCTQPPETIGEPRQRGHGRRRSPRRVERPPEEWIAIAVPALITPQLWALAQERLQMNAQFAMRNARRTYLLRGLLVCGVCGHILQARTVQGQATYYACRYGGKYRDPDKPIHTCTVRADFIEPLVWRALTDLLRNPTRIRDAWEALHAETQPQSGEVQAWQQRCTQLQQQTQRLLDAYQCGLLTLDELRPRRERLQRELRGLEARLAQVTAHPPIELALDIFTQRITRALQAPDPETQQEVIRLLIERVVISDNEITIEHIIPLDDSCQLCTADC